jgi:hypothetical protein
MIWLWGGVFRASGQAWEGLGGLGRARLQRGSVHVRNRLRELLQRFSEEEDVPSMRYVSPKLVRI